MLNEEMISKAVNVLVDQNRFEIKNIHRADNNFGNFTVDLVKKDAFNVRFINDRGQLWCDIGIGADWVLLSDVLNVLGVNFTYDLSDNCYNNMKKISLVIHNHYDLLKNAMGGKNYVNTVKRIEEIKEKRAEEMIAGFSRNP